jgi:hypothetical protein
MVGNIVFPMIFWVFLEMYENINSKSEVLQKKSLLSGICPWIMLALINMLSGMCSAMGVIFGSGIIALLTLFLLFFSKNWKVLPGAFLCVVPNLIYLAIYFSVWSR